MLPVAGAANAHPGGGGSRFLSFSLHQLLPQSTYLLSREHPHPPIYTSRGMVVYFFRLGKTGNSSCRQPAKVIVADQRLTELRAEAARRNEITVDSLLSTLRENIDRAFQATPVRDRTGKIIPGAYTYDGQVVVKSVEVMAKILGVSKEQREHTGLNAGPIPVALTVMDLVKAALTYIDSQGTVVEDDPEEVA